MHYEDIAKEIKSRQLARGLRVHLPRLSRLISTSLKDLGAEIAIVKVGKGEYILRELKAKPMPTCEVTEPDDKEEKQYKIISSFGMFWPIRAPFVGPHYHGCSAFHNLCRAGRFQRTARSSISFTTRGKWFMSGVPRIAPWDAAFTNTRPTVFLPAGIGSLGSAPPRFPRKGPLRHCRQSTNRVK